MNCTSCNSEILPGSQFCGNCGSAILIESEPSIQNSVKTSVGFFKAIKLGLSKWKDYKGRSSRREYWWFYLFTWLLSLGAVIMDSMSGTGELFYWIAAIVTFTPAIAAGARRLHDVDKSGWWQLISITIIGIIPLIIWMASEGGKKKNQSSDYGS